MNLFVTRPLKEIIEVSDLIRGGNFSKRVDKRFGVGKRNEVSVLSMTINSMADEIQKLTTGLKNEVYAQTKEIQLQNKTFFDILSNFIIFYQKFAVLLLFCKPYGIPSSINSES